MSAAEETSEDPVRLNALGIECKYAGRFDEGRRHYERALELVLATGGADSPDVAALLHNLGGIEHARGDHAGAEPYARAALELRARLLGDDDVEVAADRAAHAAILDALGEHEQAEAGFTAALAILPPEHHAHAVTLANLATLRQREGRLDEAQELYEQALALKARHLGPDHPDLAITQRNLAINQRLRQHTQPIRAGASRWDRRPARPAARSRG